MKRLKFSVQFGDAQTDWTSNSGSFTIGRHPSCELSFADETDERQYVSTRHARIESNSQGVFCSDIGSTNGTFLNGERLQFTALLKVGDRIGLGQHGPVLTVLSMEDSGEAPSTDDHVHSDDVTTKASRPDATRQDTVTKPSNDPIVPMEAPPVLQPGFEPFPGYTLERPLGQGGFGQVWLAAAPGDVLVALKFLMRSQLIEVETKGLQLLTRIRHPNLVDVQWIQTLQGALVIAMPYCDGGTLSDRLRECQKADAEGIPRKELFGYMADAARAIDFLNSPRHQLGEDGVVGVQHRDIKPANIFRVGDSARVSDFGLAKIVVDQAEHSADKGTVSYRAPETWLSQPSICLRSDQYSLAVTYAELLTGLRPSPFPVQQIEDKGYFEQLGPGALTETERNALQRGMAPDPDNRFETCSDFVASMKP